MKFNKNTLNSQTYQKLFDLINGLYHLPEQQNKLLFHGWHHIKFVHDKALEFAQELTADLTLVASAALVHDLNYIFTDKLEPEAANKQINEYLVKAGFTKGETAKILGIIEAAHLEYRGQRELTNEAKALADADTLFKALPTTPILFASKFISQNKYDVAKLAQKIVDEQEPLLQKDIYFYSQSAKAKYSQWAQINLTMWKNVLESLKDPAITEMLQNAEELGVL